MSYLKMLYREILLDSQSRFDRRLQLLTQTKNNHSKTSFRQSSLKAIETLSNQRLSRQISYLINLLENQSLKNQLEYKKIMISNKTKFHPQELKVSKEIEKTHRVLTTRKNITFRVYYLKTMLILHLQLKEIINYYSIGILILKPTFK